jgi:hypothetical protein
MIRLLLLAAAAWCGCARSAEPEVWIEASRLVGTRNDQVLVRCRQSGLAEPLVYAWTLGSAAGGGPGSSIRDQPALLLSSAPNAVAANTQVTCTISDAGGRKLSASVLLGQIAVSAARLDHETLVAEGSGFGPTRGADDAIWLVPARGAARPADHACKDAVWSDARIVACRPPSLLPGRYEVRVQSTGRLGRAAAPLVIE